MRRNSNNAILLGVASAIADFFKVDVSVVRIIFIVCALFKSLSTVLIYMGLSLIIPEGK